MKHFVLLMQWILVSIYAPGIAFDVHASVFDRPFDHDVDWKVPPGSLYAYIFGGTGTSGGVGTTETCTGAPSVHFKAKRGTTLEAALDEFENDNPEYQWRIDGDVANLMPKAGFPLLDTRIRSFNVETADNEGNAIVSDLMKLPEVRQRSAELNLKPGIWQGGPTAYEEHPAPRSPVPIHLSFRNVSLREALNSFARMRGHTVWTYGERHCNGEMTYVLDIWSD